MRFTIWDEKFLLNHPVSSLPPFLGGRWSIELRLLPVKSASHFVWHVLSVHASCYNQKPLKQQVYMFGKKQFIKPPYELLRCLWYSIYSCIWYLYTHPKLWCFIGVLHASLPGLEGSVQDSPYVQQQKTGWTGHCSGCNHFPSPLPPKKNTKKTT